MQINLIPQTCHLIFIQPAVSPAIAGIKSWSLSLAISNDLPLLIYRAFAGFIEWI